MSLEKRKVGIFFSIDDKLYATELDYKSKNNFEKLINNYTKNASICDPSNNDKVKFVSIENILNSAYKHLDKKQRVNNLLVSLFAQNKIQNLPQ